MPKFFLLFQSLIWIFLVHRAKSQLFSGTFGLNYFIKNQLLTLNTFQVANIVVRLLKIVKSNLFWLVD